MTKTHLRGVRGQFLGSLGGHGVVSRGECGGDACVTCGVSREWRGVAAIFMTSRMTDGLIKYRST